VNGPPPLPARPLLLLDYDGTLAPIVPDPARAFPHRSVPALLERLAQRHPLYVVSGRDLATLGNLLKSDSGAPLPVAAIGLHGAEAGTLGRPASRPAIDANASALGMMRATLPAIEGVDVEDKGGAAFAVHYRRAPHPLRARQALGRWAAGAPGQLEAVWGKMVVELRARGVSKGAAVGQIAAAHPNQVPVYLGDDTTDEEAFDALNRLDPRAVTIKVGDGRSAARFRLESVEAVVDYLATFDR
jgi:trehalose 6-phosphate phosphatase